MTELQKEIFTRVIQLMKSNEGEYNLFAISQDKITLRQPLDSSVFSKQSGIAIKALKDEGYIKQRYASSPLRWTLTQKGWNFRSFEDQEQERLKNDHTEKVSLEMLSAQVTKLRNDYLDLKKARNSRVLSEILSMAAILISLYVLITQWLCNKSA